MAGGISFSQRFISLQLPGSDAEVVTQQDRNNSAENRGAAVIVNIYMIIVCFLYYVIALLKISCKNYTYSQLLILVKSIVFRFG